MPMIDQSSFSIDHSATSGPTKVNTTISARTITLTSAARLRMKRAPASCQSERPLIGAAGPTCGSAEAAAAAVLVSTLTSASMRGWLLVADLGIDPCIEHVDREVAGDGEGAQQNGNAQDGGIVAIERAVHEPLTDAAGRKVEVDHD